MTPTTPKPTLGPEVYKYHFGLFASLGFGLGHYQGPQLPLNRVCVGPACWYVGSTEGIRRVYVGFSSGFRDPKP